MSSLLPIAAALAVIGLVCYCSGAEGSPYTSAQWYSDYDRLFGSPKGKSLDEAGLMGTIAKLHSGAVQPVDKYKKAIVDFFYDASELNIRHCSSEWIDRLNKRYQIFIENGNNPMASYCSRMRAKTKKMCSAKFVRWARTKIALSRDETAQLVAISQNIKNPKRQASTGLQLARLIGFDGTKSYDDFKKLWASGPCGKVLNGIAKPSADGAKLIKFVSEVDDKSKVVTDLLTIFDTCKMLQSEKELRAIYKGI